MGVCTVTWGHEEMDMMHAQAFVVAPEKPTGLTATPSGSITLRWTDNSVSETGFIIERALAANFKSGLTTFASGPHIGTGAVSYHDNTTVPGTKYFYRVKADQ